MQLNVVNGGRTTPRHMRGRGHGQGSTQMRMRTTIAVPHARPQTLSVVAVECCLRNIERYLYPPQYEMAEDDNCPTDEYGGVNDPDLFAYGLSWLWQPGWLLPSPRAPANYGNLGWVLLFPGYHHAGPPPQPNPPSGELQRMVENAIQQAVSTVLPSLQRAQETATAPATTMPSSAADLNPTTTTVPAPPTSADVATALTKPLDRGPRHLLQLPTPQNSQQVSTG